MLTCIGSKGREIYNTFIVENDEDKMTLSVIITKFYEYCTPRKSLTYLRNKLFTYRQEKGQPFDDFVTQLKKSASICQFSTLKESLMRDIIVAGILENRFTGKDAQRQRVNVRKNNKYGTLC